VWQVAAVIRGVDAGRILRVQHGREILQFACDFANKFIDARAADDDHIPMVLPETGGTSGPRPGCQHRRRNRLRHAAASRPGTSAGISSGSA
jgi:hypothetical protein